MYLVFGLGIGSLLLIAHAVLYWLRGMYTYIRLDKEGVIREERDLREQLGYAFAKVTDLTEEGKAKQAEINARLKELSARTAHYNYLMNIADFCVFAGIASGVGAAVVFRLFFA